MYEKHFGFSKLPFSVAADPSYGQLSKLSADEMLPIANERGNVPDMPGKRDPLDLVLWQRSTPDEPGSATMLYLLPRLASNGTSSSPALPVRRPRRVSSTRASTLARSAWKWRRMSEASPSSSIVTAKRPSQSASNFAGERSSLPGMAPPSESVTAPRTPACAPDSVAKTIAPREADVQRGPNVGERTFRLNGKREVMNEVKKRNHHLVEVIGAVDRPAAVGVRERRLGGGEALDGRVDVDVDDFQRAGAHRAGIDIDFARLAASRLPLGNRMSLPRRLARRLGLRAEAQATGLRSREAASSTPP